MSFWQTRKKPFFVLAPMADVSDPAYRRLIAEIHPPDVMWTEFVSADGLYHTREQKGMQDEENPLVRDLLYSGKERPIVAQLFSSNPEMMAYGAELCALRGFDGVDINMGCPDKSIEKQGAGAAMIKTPELAKQIVAAAREGAARAAATLGTEAIPISVKTRIGYNHEVIDEWIPALLELQLPALTVHLRTRKEMSKVDAHWELVPRILELRDTIASETLIIGNGDIADLADAKSRLEKSGADGAMLGRAIFGNPWLFSGRSVEEIPARERLDALLTLARYFDGLRPRKSFHLLKKHFKAFITGFDGAAELRGKLMEINSLEEMKAILAGDNVLGV